MWPFLISPLGRKIAGAIAVLVLLAGVTLYIYNKGKAEGQIQSARAQLETDRQQFEQDRKVFLDTLATYKAKDEVAQQLIASQDAQLEMLRTSRVASRAAVAKLPDADVVKDIHQKLGQAPTDAPLTIGELRRVDEVLTDYPNVLAQNVALDKKIDALGQRVDALEHQRDAAISAYNKLVPLYAKAYNAAQKKHAKIWKILSFGLLKDKKLDLPDPVTLEKP